MSAPTPDTQSHKIIHLDYPGGPHDVITGGSGGVCPPHTLSGTKEGGMEGTLVPSHLVQNDDHNPNNPLNDSPGVVCPSLPSSSVTAMTDSDGQDGHLGMGSEGETDIGFPFSIDGELPELPAVDPLEDLDIFDGSEGGQNTLSSARKTILWILEDMKSQADGVDWAKTLYRDWVKKPDYLIIQRRVNDAGKIETSRFACKAAKRGNDVYSKRINERLLPIKKYFFDKPIIESINKTGKTNILLITCTFGDRDNCTIGEAWGMVGTQWNIFITKMRKEYGDISVLRAWESHENGYPHIHAILVCGGNDFSVFRHTNPHGKMTWRLTSRSQKDAIEASWGKGFVDVEGIDNPNKAFKYILKYIFGEGKESGKKDIISLAMNWIFRKRQFSVSQLDLMSRCITQTKYLPNLQTDLFGNVISKVEYKFLGVLTIKFAGGEPPPWNIEFKNRPVLDDKLLRTLKTKYEGMA